MTPSDLKAFIFIMLMVTFQKQRLLLGCVRKPRNTFSKMMLYCVRKEGHIIIGCFSFDFLCINQLLLFSLFCLFLLYYQLFNHSLEYRQIRFDFPPYLLTCD